jgi:excisionase family DNA binding protein
MSPKVIVCLLRNRTIMLTELKSHRCREKEMAKMLNVSERTLRNWRASKLVPYTKIGRVILFDPEKVFQALEKFGRQEAP